MLTLISTKFKFKKIIDCSGIGTITIIEQLTFYKVKSFQTEQHKALKRQKYPLLVKFTEEKIKNMSTTT